MWSDFAGSSAMQCNVLHPGFLLASQPANASTVSLPLFVLVPIKGICLSLGSLLRYTA